ncbi:DUF5110 domain-containing protein [Puia sp. P3]|uniref:DUF5110 domain-containing protein n=1 Tax=Puia sp. P3 TaxID=3423952 RepID=UPI003D663D5D
MSLIPYLYSAFADYYNKGIPPFRPLVMDFPADRKVRPIANQYMIGPSIMAAPATMDSAARTVYFPEGIWYDYYSHQRYEGGKSYLLEISLDRLPLWVRSGSIIPVAEPVEHVDANTVFSVRCVVFGDGASDAALFEDDGLTYDYRKGVYNSVVLSVVKGRGVVSRKGNYKGKKYNIGNWEFIK